LDNDIVNIPSHKKNNNNEKKNKKEENPAKFNSTENMYIFDYFIII